MIHNRNIQIDNVETKLSNTGNTKYILVAGRDKFYFWQLHKGVDSPVFQSYQGMSEAGLIKKGAVVAIGYTEEEESFVNKEGKTVNFTSRCIISLREAGDGAEPTQAQNSSPRATQSVTQSPSEPRNYEREAYEKCCSIWAAALIQHQGIQVQKNGYSQITGIGQLEAGEFWNLFQAIKADGEKRFATGWAKAEAIFKDEVPTIDETPPIEAYSEDELAKDIPF